MKTRTGLAFLVALGLSGIAWAGQNNTNQGPQELRLELNLVDGSRIIGVPAIETVPIQTSYARMDVPLKHVLSIKVEENHETASLALRNGDKLQGVLSLTPIKLRATFGDVAIGLEYVREFRVLLTGGVLPESLKKGQVLHYSFDNDGNEKVTDQSGSAHDGRVDGAKWTPEGKVGGACSFNGRSDVIAVDSFSTDSDDVTVSAWIKPASFDRDGACWNPVVDTWSPDGGGQTPFRLGFLNSPAPGVMVWMYAKDGVGVDLKSSALPLDTWTHVVGVRKYEAGVYTLTIYVNGAQDNSSTSTRLPAKSTSQEIAIGARTKNPGNDERFHGLIDEVRIFSRALSAGEVTQLHSASK